jgi:hypothetical protein
MDNQPLIGQPKSCQKLAVSLGETPRKLTLFLTKIREQPQQVPVSICKCVRFPDTLRACLTINACAREREVTIWQTCHQAISFLMVLAFPIPGLFQRNRTRYDSDTAVQSRQLRMRLCARDDGHKLT